MARISEPAEGVSLSTSGHLHVKGGQWVGSAAQRTSSAYQRTHLSVPRSFRSTGLGDFGWGEFGFFEARRQAASWFNDLRLPSATPTKPGTFSICSLALPLTSMQGSTVIIYSPARPGRQGSHLLEPPRMYPIRLQSELATVPVPSTYLPSANCQITGSIKYLLCSARNSIFSTFSTLSVASRMNLHSELTTLFRGPVWISSCKRVAGYLPWYCRDLWIDTGRYLPDRYLPDR